MRLKSTAKTEFESHQITVSICRIQENFEQQWQTLVAFTYWPAVQKGIATMPSFSLPASCATFETALDDVNQHYGTVVTVLSHYSTSKPCWALSAEGHDVTWKSRLWRNSFLCQLCRRMNPPPTPQTQSPSYCLHLFILLSPLSASTAGEPKDRPFSHFDSDFVSHCHDPLSTDIQEFASGNLSCCSCRGRLVRHTGGKCPD